ncbi:putative cardiolipin synthase [Alteracholeplasma palmae J233]|uniref:Cardiolipin synthase n=1 Tax=Alteracholeplasma palmae (strain ATCC 49389 / J233) TaxID=1318466 RepID=U4KS19_ALTPJ|nr:cardiolipin synthase [Alteracholeplasma palmae]CCV64641.1 putative cardiolipin synthase [Alteracholeplasma palmae J233]
MKKLISLLLNRLTLVLLLILAQFIVLVWLINFFSNSWQNIQIALMVLSLLMVLYILTRNDNPEFKLAWVIPILAFPIFGGFFYLFFRAQNLNMKTRNHLYNVVKERQYILSQNIDYGLKGNYKKIETFLESDFWPSYKHTNSIFLPSGESKLKVLLEDLKKAEKFIFMEYFIITKSKMWDEILEVLIEKQKQGVEIRIMYDDFGSATKLPLGYYKKLRALGFKVISFNTLKVHLNFAMNYRDHRKIVVIDNKIGYTGGINIGDEYTNSTKTFGHWHDAAIKIEGDAVWTLTILFLENWRFSTKEKISYEDYYLDYKVEKPNGLYVPFGDLPLDKNHMAKDIYLSLISEANESIYISTPYLILDNEMVTALKLAAKSGIDVNIVIPGIPDKKMVYMVSESYVPELLLAGVKVYKYKPGFIHSKIIVVDRKVAMIGTSNLDYRSLYLHFENNIFLYDASSIIDMVDYFIETIADSVLITPQEMKKRNIFYRVIQTILRAFSPLL